MTQYEIKVTGRVQGVGFRFYTQKQATIFELKGWVRNSSDGGVLIVVQGEETMVETFIDYLRIDPVLSRVTNITKVKMQLVTEFSNFEVRY